MKKIIVILIAGFLVLPVRAQTVVPCSEDGYTVVFVNGVFTGLVEAEKSKEDLWRKFSDRFPNRVDVSFEVGHNQTHLAGVGDAVNSAAQSADFSLSDYDLKTILMQIHPNVTTQKILLVGHSQGTFYTNEIYEYLTGNGVPKESIGIYNVATPASFVADEATAGVGDYLTSAEDGVINWVRGRAAGTKTTQPLTANILIPYQASDPMGQGDRFSGHAFSGVYLAGASGRIVSEINAALDGLTATASVTAEEGCFNPPEETWGYKTEKFGFSVADPASENFLVAADDTATSIVYVWDVTKNAAVFTWNVTKTTGRAIVGTGNAAAQMIGQGIIDMGSFAKSTGTWAFRNTTELAADISGGFGAFWGMAVNRIAPDDDLSYLEADLFAIVDPMYIEPEEVVVEEEERRMEDESEAREEFDTGGNEDNQGQTPQEPDTTVPGTVVSDGEDSVTIPPTLDPEPLPEDEEELPVISSQESGVGEEEESNAGPTGPPSKTRPTAWGIGTSSSGRSAAATPSVAVAPKVFSPTVAAVAEEDEDDTTIAMKTFIGGENMMLVVWSEDTRVDIEGTLYDDTLILGRRIRSDGSWVDIEPIVISDPAPRNMRYSIVGIEQDGEFVVLMSTRDSVWRQGDSGSPHGINVVRIPSNGELPGDITETEIYSTSYYRYDGGRAPTLHDVTLLGDDLFVLWNVGRGVFKAGILKDDNVLQGETIVRANGNLRINGSNAVCTATNCFVAWSTRYGIRIISFDMTKEKWWQGGGNCPNFGSWCPGALLVNNTAYLSGGMRNNMLFVGEEDILVAWTAEDEFVYGNIFNKYDVVDSDWGDTEGEDLLYFGEYTEKIRYLAMGVLADDSGVLLVTSVADMPGMIVAVVRGEDEIPITLQAVPDVVTSWAFGVVCTSSDCFVGWQGKYQEVEGIHVVVASDLLQAEVPALE